MSIVAMVWIQLIKSQGRCIALRFTIYIHVCGWQHDTFCIYIHRHRTSFVIYSSFDAINKVKWYSTSYIRSLSYTIGYTNIRITHSWTDWIVKASSTAVRTKYQGIVQKKEIWSFWQRASPVARVNVADF